MGDAVFGSYLLMFAFKALGVFVAVVFIIGFARKQYASVARADAGYAG